MGLEFDIIGKFLTKKKRNNSSSIAPPEYIFVGTDIKSDVPDLSFVVLNNNIKVKHILNSAVSYWTVSGNELKIGQAGSFDLILVFSSNNAAKLAEERLQRIINGEVVS